jgi:hypothetical protein
MVSAMAIAMAMAMAMANRSSPTSSLVLFTLV